VGIFRRATWEKRRPFARARRRIFDPVRRRQLRPPPTPPRLSLGIVETSLDTSQSNHDDDDNYDDDDGGGGDVDGDGDGDHYSPVHTYTQYYDTLWGHILL